eukprot:TRINITY_DN70354_c0_g1_i1.p1 TRINITY_DN70354_c0_g1~~TRINITY_DN70354_c0_g1_i1.p1  ORF type:complete len:305 (+),score=8.40 TRINITY_DN70354_c0_g1_i1:32-946(+)
MICVLCSPILWWCGPVPYPAPCGTPGMREAMHSLPALWAVLLTTPPGSMGFISGTASTTVSPTSEVKCTVDNCGEYLQTQVCQCDVSCKTRGDCCGNYDVCHSAAGLREPPAGRWNISFTSALKTAFVNTLSSVVVCPFSLPAFCHRYPVCPPCHENMECNGHARAYSKAAGVIKCMCTGNWAGSRCEVCNRTRFKGWACTDCTELYAGPNCSQCAAGTVGSFPSCTAIGGMQDKEKLGYHPLFNPISISVGLLLAAGGTCCIRRRLRRRPEVPPWASGFPGFKEGMRELHAVANARIPAVLDD